ncbi:facilitated trehalose transporter Tret1-like [Atheta coriaria]|uniref:facilitated trehalose transporter Tret1-like n=1 Tax=Dalotia coriaria TaxID=877792 RepID=UPI0031F3A6BB
MAVEHRSTDSKQWRQIYTIFTVSLNTITTGQFMSWPSPTIPILRQQGVSMEEATYLTIIPPVTAIIASPLVGKLIDWIGRRPAILSVTISYCICWILIALAANTTISTTDFTFWYLPRPLYIYYTARVFNGIGDACVFTTIPCYVTEISTPSIRGTWGTSVAFSIFIGQFLANIIGAYLSIAHTAYLSLLIPVMFLLNYYFIKETPYYLLMKGRVDDARSSLQWLRNTSATYVEEELTQLNNDVQRQLSEPGRYYDLIKISSNRKACLIGILTRACQQFSGINAFTVYAQTIFMESGSDLSPSMSAIVFTGILLICTFVTSFILDILGRRRAMLISCTGSSVVLFIQTAFFYIQDETDITLNGFQMFPLISMVIFVIFYSIGLGLVPTSILGELFSSSVKSKAFVVMNIFYGFSMASSAMVFAFCLDIAGLYAAFLCVAICSAISILISYWFVPETKGKTLEEIQQSFKK